MADEFVPLSVFLRAPSVEPVRDAPIATEAPALPALPAEYDEALRAAKRFRAGIADAIDAALPSLLETIARDVLARELLLHGADLAAVVEAALDRCDDVVSIRAHSSDLAAVRKLRVESRADDSLHPGDVCIDLRSGTIELSLEARVQSALRALA
jgi:flagellar biosynthesis/type III secretory pathway protein FliH